MADATGAMPAAAASRLQRTRRIATAVLIALALVFCATFVAGTEPPVILLLRAMAEAGMVGGLADWFAVTALFRHPMGLPIPHTALLQRRQGQVADNVGRFFSQHFLQPGHIRAELRALSPTGLLLGWVTRRENALLVAHELRALLAALLQRPLPPVLAQQALAAVRTGAVDLGDNQKIAEGLVRIAKDSFRSQFADQTIGLVRDAIDQRRDAVLQVVQDNSRWWIATPIDRRAANLVVGAVLSLLDDLMRDGSAARLHLHAAFDDLSDQILTKGVLRDAVADARRNLVNSGMADQQAMALATLLRDTAARHLSDTPQNTERLLAIAIRQSARTLAKDADMMQALDRRLSDLLATIVGNGRDSIATYVTDVIKGWSPQDLNARFEEEIGPDLQFIRINGAAFGAMIGGVLFGFEHLFDLLR